MELKITKKKYPESRTSTGVWIETLGMALVLFAQIYRTKYGARIEMYLT